jgi:hypothetical protein
MWNPGITWTAMWNPGITWTAMWNPGNTGPLQSPRQNLEGNRPLCKSRFALRLNLQGLQVCRWFAVSRKKVLGKKFPAK